MLEKAVMSMQDQSDTEDPAESPRLMPGLSPIGVVERTADSMASVPPGLTHQSNVTVASFKHPTRTQTLPPVDRTREAESSVPLVKPPFMKPMGSGPPEDRPSDGGDSDGGSHWDQGHRRGDSGERTHFPLDITGALGVG